MDNQGSDATLITITADILLEKQSLYPLLEELAQRGI